MPSTIFPVSGISGDINWKVWRMEHAATLDIAALKNVETNVNPIDHYCYKIHIKNTSTTKYLFDIHTEIDWKVTANPTSGPMTTASAQIIDFVEPFPHAALRWTTTDVGKANCLTVLFRSLPPEGEAESAISFLIQGMGELSTFEILLDTIYYTPYLQITSLQPQKTQKYSFIPKITEDTVD